MSHQQYPSYQSHYTLPSHDEPQYSYLPPDSYNDFNNLSASQSNSRFSKRSEDLLLDRVVPPILGNDWAREESKGERYAKATMRKEKAGAWAGRGWGKVRDGGKKVKSSKVLLFGTFAFLVALGLTLYFVLPRAPGLTYSNLLSTDASPSISSSSATFNFNANLSVDFNTMSTYLPLKVSNIQVTVNEVSSGKQIGLGSSSLSVPAKDITTHNIPIKFTAQFSNSSDATFQKISSACGPQYTNVNRGTLELSFLIEMKIAGLIGTKKASMVQEDVTCPVFFPTSG